MINVQMENFQLKKIYFINFSVKIFSIFTNTTDKYKSQINNTGNMLKVIIKETLLYFCIYQNSNNLKYSVVLKKINELNVRGK